MTDRSRMDDRGTGLSARPPAILLLALAFAQDQLTTLRHAVNRRATIAGLRGQRLEDFVFSVNEVTTNAVRHGGGTGHLRLWTAERTLLCEVSDQGPGLPSNRVAGSWLPSRYASSGRGLWLVRHLSDAQLVATGPHGTTIRISAALP